ncbi:hypothetical protein SDC9_211610 [bioreactor metagenome]|uniref:Uncharacterized protein n=1 Tax=bioreactor metagenome TaxID=1076179 RepID=A0A645JXG3_9ZZZZ
MGCILTDGGVQIKRTQRQAGKERANDHDAFERDIDDAAALAEHAAKRDQQQRNSKQDRSTENIG